MASEGLVEKALKTLNEKSEKARSIAKQALLEEKIGLKKVDDIIERYLLGWNDTTRSGMLAIACEAVGGNLEEVVPLQVALLFIDATMDIHDDIIDESVTKKNRKTVYGKLGKEATLLIGDALMVKGFSNLNRALEDLPKNRRLKIIDGVRDFLLEVVNAHISEAPLKARKRRVKPETYLEILTKKAADIEGRMKVGAIYGGGSATEIKALSKYGRNFGVLLAVRSDFIDVFEPGELMHRIQHECLPLQVLYALQSRKHRKRIQEILLKATLTKEDCNELVEIICETTEWFRLKQYLVNLEKETKQALNVLPTTQAKNELCLLAASMLEDL